ncbi:response regulator transcription factor [Hymenobacter convexus]|uniref:response regulator transcription factor n=1 Tax=Hymenobacter sp. CA1UV-4 TaxID=3063782 RepID=UPI002714445B|nr:response regulator transcription factor [Hymenobacter sp. CA1UV-4]MDO7851686.1 response regulator transcription factor [Hymenobacter sp. CA1UV-4]
MAAPSSPAHIALLDDHPMFRQGLRFILQSLPYVAAVEEASTLPGLLVICEQRLPDVLLLDMQMPGADGAEVAQQLLRQYPALKIIVLSMFSADKYITQMMKLGARSYLPKDANQEELIHALEEVLTTGYHFTPRISRALMRGLHQPTRPPSVKLQEQEQFTPREQEVLRLICEGRTAAEIAAHLFISRRTVEGHWQKLLEKTGAPNAAGLVGFAAKHGLLES